LELGNLSNLEILSLGTNDFSGSIPDSFGHLRKLQKLDLRRNRLSGKVPNTLSDLQSLNYINLTDNNLYGDIPVQLLQVGHDFTGNNLNCDQQSIPCVKDTMNATLLRVREKEKGTKRKLWVMAVVVPLVAALICFIFCFGWMTRHKKGQLHVKMVFYYNYYYLQAVIKFFL